ncbi:MAG: baseplate J/gp47 family protein, partial [Candidatus Heimdallarchaeaceae archaeon]
MAHVNLLNYVNYDFDELVAQLQNRLIAKDGAWVDVYKSATGQMLLEFYAYVANLTMFYLERRAEECYLGTAQNRSSVVNMVKLINYKPKRRTAATGIVRFSYPSAHTTKIYIPRYLRLRSADGIDYIVGYKKKESSDIGEEYEELIAKAQDLVSSGDLTTRDLQLITKALTSTNIIKAWEYSGEISGEGYISSTSDSDGNYTDVPVIQGSKVELQITSTGAANQVFIISDTDVDNDIFQVLVDGVPWVSKSSFATSDAEDLHFIIDQQLDDSLKLYFGDGIQGKIPPLGSIILVVYIKTEGLSGNVYQADQSFTILDTIFDDDLNEVSGVTATNPENIIDGDDAESIDEIKYEAPRVFKTGDRAVTKADFKAILENMAGIAVANVWGENEEDPPNYDMFNRVNICILMQNWAHPTTEKKASISSDLEDKSLITVKYEYITAVILDVVVEFPEYSSDILGQDITGVMVVKGGSMQQAELDIEEALEAEFNLDTKTVTLGESVMLS